MAFLVSAATSVPHGKFTLGHGRATVPVTASEAKFLSKRRAEFAGAELSVPRLISEIDKLPKVWTAKHKREAQFLKQKRLSKKSTAAADGLLSKREDPQGAFRKAGFAAMAKIAKAVAKRLRTPNSLQSAGPLNPRLYFKGRTVAVTTSSTDVAVAGALRELRMTETKELSEAQVFVVASPQNFNAAYDAVWAAALLGGFLVAPASLHGRAHPYFKFQCAVESLRVVYVSQAFIERHPAKCQTEISL